MPNIEEPICDIIVSDKVKLKDLTLAPIKDGRYLVTEDTNEIYYDFGSKRTKIRDIIVVESFVDIDKTKIFKNDFVYAKDNKTLYFCENDNDLTISIPSKFIAQITTTSSLTYTINHNKTTDFVIVQVIDAKTGNNVSCDIKRNLNDIVITFPAGTQAGLTFKIVII